MSRFKSARSDGSFTARCGRLPAGESQRASKDPSQRAGQAARAKRFAELASEMAALCAEAIEEDALETVPDDSLGQALGSVVRLYAAKAQGGPAPFPFARNSGVTDTDVMIGCTAMLDGLGLNTFELGMWQDISGIGKLERSDRPRVPSKWDRKTKRGG